jgi:L-rhamnose mutarotase
MIRKAFRMSVAPGHQAEYIRRHNPIWRDLEDVLLQHGVGSYSIFLDPATDDLFAYAEIESEERWAAIAETLLTNPSGHESTKDHENTKRTKGRKPRNFSAFPK